MGSSKISHRPPSEGDKELFWLTIVYNKVPQDLVK